MGGGVQRYLFGDPDLFGELNPFIERRTPAPVVRPEDAVVEFNRHQGVFPFPEPTSDTRGNLMLPLDSGYQVK